MMMKTKILALFCTAFLTSAALSGYAAFSQSVMAQPRAAASGAEEADQCNFAYEVITKLRKPVFGAYNIWDTVYGDLSAREHAKAAVIALDENNDNLVMAGLKYAPVVAPQEAEAAEGENSAETGEASETTEATETNEAEAEAEAQNFAPPLLFFVELDRRGRSVWSIEHTIKDLYDIRKMKVIGKHYVLMGNTRTENGRERIWLGFFNEDGTLDKQYDVGVNGYNLQGLDFILAHGGRALLITSAKTPVASSRSAETPATMLSWFDLQSRRLVRDRTLAMGMENRIEAILQHGEEHYIAAGAVRMNDGRWGGWVARLNTDGSFVWQLPMPRGMGGRFYQVAPLTDRYIVAAGEAMPIGDEPKRAAWVAALDVSSSQIAWQRFYRDDYDLSSVQLISHADHQISLVINASDSLNEEDFDFVRVANLDPRGHMIDSRGYYNGVGAQAAGVVTGKHGERILFGSTRITYQVEAAQNDETELKTIEAQQAWAVAGTRQDPYDDPCVSRSRLLQ